MKDLILIGVIGHSSKSNKKQTTTRYYFAGLIEKLKQLISPALCLKRTCTAWVVNFATPFYIDLWINELMAKSRQILKHSVNDTSDTKKQQKTWSFLVLRSDCITSQKTKKVLKNECECTYKWPIYSASRMYNFLHVLNYKLLKVSNSGIRPVEEIALSILITSYCSGPQLWETALQTLLMHACLGGKNTLIADNNTEI